MREFQNMKQSITGDDPLSREIINFKKKREQADMIEQIFRNIKSNYGKTDINSMKNNLDKILSLTNPVYNPSVASGYFGKIKADLSNKAFQSPEFQEGRIIHNFSLEEPRGRAAPSAHNRPVSPGTIANRPSQTKFPYDQVTPLRPETAQPPADFPVAKRNPSPKTVTFDPSIPDNEVGGSGSIIKGKQPAAKVSPEKDESQLNYKISNPKFSHLKNIHLATAGGIPTAIRSFDNRNLVVGCADGALKIIDTVPSSVVKQYKFSSKVRVIEAVSDDGKTGLEMGALIGLGQPDNAIVLLDLAKSESALNKFRVHTDEVTGIVFLGNGDFLSCSFDGTVAYWNMGNQVPLNRIQAHQGKINSMASLNNNTTLVTGGDDMTVQVFAVRRGEIALKKTIKETSPVTLVNTFHGNSKFAFSCHLNGSIKIWNVDTGE